MSGSQRLTRWRALGVPAGAPQRVDAALIHTLREAGQRSGHCYLPREQLVGKAASLLGPGIALDDGGDDPYTAFDQIGKDDPYAPFGDPGAAVGDEASDGQLQAIGRRITELERSGALVSYDNGERPVRDGALIAEGRLARIEKQLVESIAWLLEQPAAWSIEIDSADLQLPGGISLTREQAAAIEITVHSRLSILTGGPGTGKTTSMRALVQATTDPGLTVALCSPTGRGARRLSQATGADASTIHRLLEYSPDPNIGFRRHASNPIEADLIICDESSMLDVRLAGHLFDAVGDSTHVLLVGDVDQLPPVGPGQPFADLIAGGAVPCTRLGTIHRQAQGSAIIRAAYEINHGHMPDPGEPGCDFRMIKASGPEDLSRIVVELATNVIPDAYRLDPATGVQVLSPRYDGAAGVDALNDQLRERVNGSGRQIRGTSFRVGDRLMQQVNDYELDLMNGEILAIDRWYPDTSEVVVHAVDGWSTKLPISALATMKLAYASTAHKFQGSEVPAVVIAINRGSSFMLSRNLIYTAVTRAKQVCALVYEDGILDQALRRRDAGARHTQLAELLKADQAIGHERPLGVHVSRRTR